MEITKTITIVKKARKYFDCTVNGFKAKLVINEVSKNFEPGQEISVRVNDISERSNYGVALKFEPIAVAGSAEDVQNRRKSEVLSKVARWLGYAESDAKSGMTRTNAITEALYHCPGHPEFADRLDALKTKIAENTKVFELKKLQRAAEKMESAKKNKSSRILYPLSHKPEFHQPVRLGNRVVVFESTGAAFYINADHPSYEGYHLLGHEGERGCYCYYREATGDEISAMSR